MNAWQCRHTVATLKQDGVIAYPTDTVYGLGCEPSSAKAVARLLYIKQRPWWKGLILVAHHIDLILPYIHASPEQIAAAKQTWPGPYTWVFPAQDWVPAYLTGLHDGIAVRVTDFPVIEHICELLHMPLVSSSANISSRPVVRNRFQLQKYFANQVDYIVPGNTGNANQSSQIRHAITQQIIR